MNLINAIDLNTVSTTFSYFPLMGRGMLFVFLYNPRRKLVQNVLPRSKPDFPLFELVLYYAYRQFTLHFEAVVTVVFSKQGEITLVKKLNRFGDVCVLELDQSSSYF